LKELFLFF